MNTDLTLERSAAAHVPTCPLGEHGVQPHDRLHLPMSRRMVAQVHEDGAGGRELRLYHGDKEISFDDPAMFGFGEALARQTRFAAADAMQWGPGYAWPQVRELLQALIDEGVVLRVAHDDEAVEPARAELDQPSPLPPAPADTPHTWLDCEALMLQITGRSLPQGWLEVVVPVFRVAHLALDADGRQVGESNVFPPSQRLDVPTRWRTCIYEGTRYLSDRPMNVTALKAMRAHWGTMMALLLQVRKAYLSRCPGAREGWTVAHLERYATAVLALPSVLLMRGADPVAHGALHPALSSLFRVTDGMRMTTHQMLFVPLGEPTRSPQARITSAEVMAYAERNHSFFSDHGVCAGPKAMIEEFLAVAVDGRLPRNGLAALDEPALAQACAAIEAALDYAFHGLRVHGTVFSLWPAMAQAYETLAGLAEGAQRAGHPGVAVLHGRLQQHLATLRQVGYLGRAKWRAEREAAYDDMVCACEQALGLPTAPGNLAHRLAPVSEPADESARAALLQALRRTVGLGVGEPSPVFVQALAEAVLGHLQTTRAVLRAASEAQRGLNHLLGRPAPSRPLLAADLDLHNRLQAPSPGRLPFLIDELQSLLGLDIVVSATSLRVSLRRPNAPG